MITIKSREDIAHMKQAGRILARILESVVARTCVGVSVSELDVLAREGMKVNGVTPAFLGYGASRTKPGFPGVLCVSVNDEVVHGTPARTLCLNEGDIVGLDIGLIDSNGWYADMAVTVGIGVIDNQSRVLISTARRALDKTIAMVRPGIETRALSREIQRITESAGFSAIRDLTGHGIGRSLHEDPPIFDYDDPRLPSTVLREGMVICLEPMITVGHWRVTTDDDGWTVRSADGSRSAHFEHTIAVTHNGHEILTLP